MEKVIEERLTIADFIGLKFFSNRKLFFRSIFYPFQFPHISFSTCSIFLSFVCRSFHKWTNVTVLWSLYFYTFLFWHSFTDTHKHTHDMSSIFSLKWGEKVKKTIKNLPQNDFLLSLAVLCLFCSKQRVCLTKNQF